MAWNPPWRRAAGMAMIKFVTRWVFRLLLLAVVLAVALLLSKDYLIKSYLEYRFHAETGLEARIGSFELALGAPTLTMENFTLYHPAQFGGGPFLVLKELHVEYDRDALASQKLRLHLVRLNLAEIDVVEDQSGQNSLQLLQGYLAQKTVPQKSESSLDFAGIDTLNLTLGRLKFHSMRPGVPDREIDLGVKNEIIQNVKTASDLNAVMLRILLRSGKSLLAPRAI